MKNDASFLISDKLKPLKKEIKNLFSLIKNYDCIVIYRHVHPDFDALGSQYGLRDFIKLNYPKKEVYCVGDNHPSFSDRIYPKSDSVSEGIFQTHKVLGIILDTANSERVSDQRYSLCKETIRIDHHPLTKNYTTYNIDGTGFVAASELLAAIILEDKKNKINAQIAKYLLSGIVGDSGRFVYSNTSPLTFAITSCLVSEDFNLQEFYMNMYEKDVKHLQVDKFILNNFIVSPKGVAYYVINDKDLKNLNIEVQEAKNDINLFANYKGIEIYVCITEDVSEPCYRVSIRSKRIDVTSVAKKYSGGGHKNACGAKIHSIEEVKTLIEDLESLIN